jgi:DeoR/GlpR family transcriptional regulator of sugar metabolism
MQQRRPRAKQLSRRDQILQTLEAQDKVRVNRLAQRFGVSTVTIRGDLRVLAQAGLVQRQHGGACTARRAPPELPLEENAASTANANTALPPAP